MIETETRENKIYFGQVFYPYGLEQNGLFVVIDTQNGPHIEASKITERVEDNRNVYRLSLAGSFPPYAANNCQDIWDKTRVINTFISSFASVPLNSNFKDLLTEFSKKPPREIH